MCSAHETLTTRTPHPMARLLKETLRCADKERYHRGPQDLSAQLRQDTTNHIPGVQPPIDYQRQKSKYNSRESFAHALCMAKILVQYRTSMTMRNHDQPTHQEPPGTCTVLYMIGSSPVKAKVPTPEPYHSWHSDSAVPGDEPTSQTNLGIAGIRYNTTLTKASIKNKYGTRLSLFLCYEAKPGTTVLDMVLQYYIEGIGTLSYLWDSTWTDLKVGHEGEVYRQYDFEVLVRVLKVSYLNLRSLSAVPECTTQSVRVWHTCGLKSGDSESSVQYEYQV
ncbi:hypothetical protein HOY82DRAFT_535842 [Tuber indicum]|nr:hypothetical protein HOY82DRAFT_535842 [Tuber indicum]